MTGNISSTGAPARIWALTLGLVAACLVSTAHAEVRLHQLFTDHMVLQRERAVPVWGWAEPGEKVTVQFAGQAVSATADKAGKWMVKLAPMKANATPQEMTITGSNSVTLEDVLVGDVWLCSGQSNMDMGLGGCNRKEDVDSADLPGIRSFRTPLTAAGEPLSVVKGNHAWVVCSSKTAAGFSAAAFYFARSIYRETKGAIPVGLLVSSVGGTSIDLWLTPEGLVDIPTLHPLLSQPVLPNGPFHLANGMFHPLAPYGLKGAIWYQGENAERSTQSKDSYFLKMKALVQGWKRLWGMDDFPFYYVMIANWGEKPKDATPVLKSGGWDADTRLQQANALALPHAGCASAIDIGDSSMGNKVWEGWHPKDKLEVGERLALWALKNDYGRPKLVASGPVLKDVAVSGSSVVCSFDSVGSGLMVGTKAWYEPTREVPGGALKHFVIAGADGQWFPATANIQGNQVRLSSPSVREPRKVSYACWQNPEGCNLFNKEGLPAAPFHVEDVTRHYSLTAKAGRGGEIQPSGTRQLLERMTALYTIQPKPGYYIQDVKVDGVSVGSVSNYTFDPVYTNHVIEATFASKAPSYTLTTSAHEGGAIIPSGAVSVAQGGTRSFAIAPNPGMSIKSVTVDGVDLGPRETISFSDVRCNHTVAAAFSCKIAAEAGYGGAISPCGEVTAEYNESLAFRIDPLPGYSVAQVLVDGKEIGATNAYAFTKVTASHSISVKFKGPVGATGKIPKTGELLFAGLAESLPAEGHPGAWSTCYPEGRKLSPIGTPETVKVDGMNFSRNRYLDGDGFNFGTYREPIACQGASIVVVARPTRTGAGSGWFSIVDVFYDRLVLGIRNDSGQVCVRRNGPIENSQATIPDGQTTILSLVVQPDGKYKVYANGVEVMANTTVSALTSLVPGEPGFAKSITVGRNAPDAWTTFNGDIGDVFLYKAALSDSERMELETYIANKLAGTPVQK